jgi:hypothetical protein
MARTDLIEEPFDEGIFSLFYVPIDVLVRSGSCEIAGLWSEMRSERNARRYLQIVWRVSNHWAIFIVKFIKNEWPSSACPVICVENVRDDGKLWARELCKCVEIHGIHRFTQCIKDCLCHVTAPRAIQDGMESLPA